MMPSVFLAKVAKTSGIPIFSVNYRKPPEFPFPEPGRDLLGVYRALRRQHDRQKLFLGGDSAGGNLALEVARTVAERSLSEEKSSTPDGLVLLSPWVDLSETSGRSWQKFKEIDFIPAEQAQVVATLYAAGRQLDDVQISPGCRMSWPKSMPPVLLEYGGCEVFRSQIEKLSKALDESNIKVEASFEDGMVHGYPLFDFLWGDDDTPFQSFFNRLDAFLRR